ncbi:MAG TPA: hypothetical protein VM012_14340 [Flavitalea sp.]|nr:hypothetical protein [Flavitalea sp.]
MKCSTRVILLTTIFFCNTLVAQKKNKPDTIPVTISLQNTAKSGLAIDSVLVIFDRYDLTGAGVVKKVYYPVNNIISIEEVPEGRYYIDVLCLGRKKYYFKHEGYIYKGRNKLAFKLPRAEVFIPGTFVSEDYFNVNNLAISSFKYKY